MGNLGGVESVSALAWGFLSYLGEGSRGSTMGCGGYVGFGPARFLPELPLPALLSTHSVQLPAITDGRNTKGLINSFVQEIRLPTVGTLVVVTLVVHIIGLAYAASKPLRLGNGQVAQNETMPYWKRLLAVSTLYLVCGGAPMLFVVTEGYLVYWVWAAWHTWWGLAPVAVLAIVTFVTMRPLPYRRPDPRVVRHPLFGLWRDYFNFTHVVQDSDMLAGLVADEGRTFFLAQLPHGIMPFGAILGSSLVDEVFMGMSPMSGVVATALLWTPIVRHVINWLGVRKAGTASINAMFSDGYKTVGVVTGGIAEMFVSQTEEKITMMRPGFASIALKGGHVVLPVFVFGASRAHVPAPGSTFLKGLSRKLRTPIMMFHGAFSVVPYRQEMKMVVGRPVILKKVAEPTQSDIQEAIGAIHGSIEEIYNDTSLKPAWETRPLRFSK